MFCSCIPRIIGFSDMSRHNFIPSFGKTFIPSAYNTWKKGMVTSQQIRLEL